MRIIFRVFKLFKESRKIGFPRRHNSSDVRVRFAPSPTGYLHLGGLRTALYNYLFAKASNGTFILRIEDTDQSRKVEGATEKLIEDLKWCGIVYDEGPNVQNIHGPYIQSERLNMYKKYVNILLETGFAYKCFCSSSRLELLRREALKLQQVPKYDNKCRSLTSEQVENKLKENMPYCVRFKLSSFEEPINDIIYGPVFYDVSTNEGDPVIFKQDGYPTYHFANVVDDHLMEVTHVLRGVEWQISTSKHILMYRAFGWKPPEYGHLPLLLNPNGTKLSKRQGDVTVDYFRQCGLFPNAVVNFVTRAGGGFNLSSEERDEKSFTIQELATKFDMTKMNTNSCKILMDRLQDSNRLELIRLLENDKTKSELVDRVEDLIKNHFGINTPRQELQLDRQHITRILMWSKNRIDKLTDLIKPDLLFLWVKCDSQSLEKLTDKDVSVLQELGEKLSAREVEEFSQDMLRQLSQQHQFKYSNLMKMLRLVLSGLKEGPGVLEMMQVLGRQTVLDRINYAVDVRTKS